MITPTPTNLRKTCFVFSPGYAWGRIQLDLSRGGERVIELGPGGGLDVFLLGDRSQADAVLRLRPLDEADSMPFMELDLMARDRLAVDGLPVGAKVVDQVPEADGRVRVRVLCDGRPHPSAEPDQPSLEDGYLMLTGTGFAGAAGAAGATP